MVVPLHALTAAGTGEFSAYLDRLRTNPTEEPPVRLLDDPSTAVRIAGGLVDASRLFASKLDAARYLHEALNGVSREQIDTNSGLWNWLALFYLAQLCPANANGARTPGEHHRYILPASDAPEHFRHYYRHLLAGPYRIYRLHREQARLLLHPPVYTHGDFSEQLASRLQLITNSGLIAAADHLYYDVTAAIPKRGATNRKKGGTLRRLVSMADQFDTTYDLYSMTAPQILGLLPPEFDRWRQPVSNVAASA
jgi:hypothetical protein